MKVQFMILLLSLTMTSVYSQTSKNTVSVTKNYEPMNVENFVDFVLWGDQRTVAILEKLTEEEFNKPFNELSGNIRSKTAHILSIYEFFMAILEQRPHEGFPSLDHLSKDELIAKWKECIKIWPLKVKEINKGLYALPPANNQRVEVQHIYIDAFSHTIHHRGQLLTFIRLLGKDKEEISPKETNIDYFTFVFSKKKDIVHAPLE